MVGLVFWVCMQLDERMQKVLCSCPVSRRGVVCRLVVSRFFFLLVATTVTVRASVSSAAGYDPAPPLLRVSITTTLRHSYMMESPSSQSTSESSYVPFEVPTHTPSAGIANASDPPPMHAPSRERPRMVAPGPFSPSEREEQEHISRQLWAHLSIQPGDASDEQGVFTPHERLSSMGQNTQQMWRHIGQTVSTNMHDTTRTCQIQASLTRSPVPAHYHQAQQQGLSHQQQIPSQGTSPASYPPAMTPMPTQVNASVPCVPPPTPSYTPQPSYMHLPQLPQVCAPTVAMHQMAPGGGVDQQNCNGQDRTSGGYSQFGVHITPLAHQMQQQQQHITAHQMQQQAEQTQQPGHQCPAQLQRSNIRGWDEQWRAHRGTNTIYNTPQNAQMPMRVMSGGMQRSPQWNDTNMGARRGGAQPASDACEQRSPTERVRGFEKGGAHQQKRPSLPPFNRSDFKYMRTSLEPSYMMTWRSLMQSRLRYKTDSVEEYAGIADECFMLSSDEWKRACFEPTERGARRAEFNSYLAEGLHGSLDPESKHVTWLRHCLEERGVHAMLDGRLILDLIAEYTFGASAAELQRREAAFKSKAYFRDSMTGPEVRAAYTEFIADHRLLPDHAQGGPFQAHIDMISKLPASCDTLRQKYTRKMYQEQARGCAAPTITLKELLELAIVDILQSQTSGVHNAEHHEFDRRPAVMMAARDDRLRQKQEAGREGRVKRCTICGDEGHSHMECTKSCKTCQMRRCPGARGQTCVVKAKTRPRQVTDAMGSQIARESYADLLAAWSKANPREAEADRKARRDKREAHKSVRYAEEETEDAAPTLADDGEDMYEEYGVASFGEQSHCRAMPQRAYVGDDSGSDDEYYMNAISCDAVACYSVGGAVHQMQPSAARTSEPLRTSLLIDSGASIHLLQTQAIRNVATEISTNAPLGFINGVGGRSPITAVLGIQLHLDGKVRIAVQAPFAGVGDGEQRNAQDILSTGQLYDETGIVTVLDPEPHLRTPAGTRVPLLRRGRYYMLEASVTPITGKGADVIHNVEPSADPPGPPSNAATMGATSSDENDLWAARLNLSSRGLKKLMTSTKGTGFKAITHRMAMLADSCTYRAASMLRRQPVPVGHTREFTPGQCLEYDVWGPAGASSLNGGERYDLHAVCVSSGYAHARKAKDHVARTVLDFIADVATKERAFGHAVMIVRMDRAPEHESAELQRGMRALQIQLELTPRNHHEGVSRAENANNMVQTMAETSTRRAELTLGYILDARIYAWNVRNLRCAAGRAHSRQEEHTGIRPDLSRRKPYIFGTRCAVLQDEAARGPKGSLHQPRSLLGTFIGFEGAAYLVRLDNGGGVVQQRSIRTLNERQLMLRGMPPSVVQVDGAAQTDLQDVVSCPSPPHRRSHFPERTCAEDGAPEDFIGPPSTRTRLASAGGAQRRAMAIEDNLVGAQDEDEARSMFNAAVFQLLGDETVHCDDAGSLDLVVAEAALSAWHPAELPSNGVHKASQSTVMVKTPLGMREERVPSTCRQVRDHPQRHEWERADRRARDVLLREGNIMVRLDSPEAEGAVMAHAVVQRKIKLDANTGGFAKHDAYKSRICVDGRRLKLGMLKLGLTTIRPMHAQVADDITIKMLLAKVAHEKGTIVKIDIVNAYAKGTRGADRERVLIRMPESVREYDDDGAELYMLGIKPMQGEQPSGDEWWHHINDALKTIGAHQAESVGGLYSGKINGSSFGVALITDDLLVGEWGGDDYAIGRGLKAQLEERYVDIKYEENPSSFTAFKITYDRERGCLTLTMDQKTMEAVYEYLPGLPKGVRPSDGLKKGQTLERLADDLRLPPIDERRAKLDASQRRVQQIIGSVKFLEKVRVDLSLAMHRLSCVMTYPPKEAVLVAELVLERAYDGRHNGITFGGAANVEPGFNIRAGAPLLLQGVADATWGLTTDLYGVLLTMNGGTVYHNTKKINVVLQSSMEAEGFATCKLGEMVEYAREIAIALGIDLGGATRCATDNSSNLQVSSGRGAANRTRHCQRRFLVFRQRVAEGSVTLEHVKDVDNPADYLTKWLSAKKFKLSVEYATNARNVVKVPQ